MVTASDLVDIRDVEIDRGRVYRRIGYSPGNKVSARVSNLIDDYIENVNDLIAPQYSYVIRDIEWIQGYRVFIEGGIIIESKVIARLLEQCQKAALFVLTIGKHLEETAQRLSDDGLILQSTVLDAIGSSAAEKTAGTVQDEIKKIVVDEYIISPRFSPGYCDWDIEQQQMIFRAVNGDQLGVQLTDTCLMLPRKSISGIIGIGAPESNVNKYNPCKTCRNGDCTSRRTNLTA